MRFCYNKGMTSKRGRQVRFWMMNVFAIAVVVCLSLVVARRIFGGVNESEGVDTATVGDIEVEKVEAKTDLFAEYYDRADEILSEMSLEEKIGQMFLARMPEDGTLGEIQRYYPGGYILFGVDFWGETPESLRQKLDTYRAASRVELVFGVDEEGGSVVRASLYPSFRETKFPAPQELYMAGGIPAVLEDSTEKSGLLASLGIKMNLAPVADVPTSAESFIYERSLGRSADETAEYVAKVVERMNQDGMISVMKHFPGYGDNVDTHTGVAIDEREYAQFRDYDFWPFLAGIRAEGPAILVSHNIVAAMDAEMPASLSSEVHRVLREELGFTGVIMTDDLAMGAVAEYTENGDVATRAVLAGNDLIITSDLAGQAQEVLGAVERGEITEAQIDQAVRRVLAMKLRYGVI